MRFAVFLLVACLSVCYSAYPKLTLWGQVTPRLLGTKGVIIPSSPPWESQNYTFTIPEVNRKTILFSFKRICAMFCISHFIFCAKAFFLHLNMNQLVHQIRQHSVEHKKFTTIYFLFRSGTKTILPNSRYSTLRFYMVIHSPILEWEHRSTQYHCSNYIRTCPTN